MHRATRCSSRRPTARWKSSRKCTSKDYHVSYTLTGGPVVWLSKGDIAAIYHKYPYAKPRFESFKFNNKFNDQLFTDALGEIDEANGKVTASVACIGKRLTPSFKLPDGANAYVDGVLQESKVSRPRFDETVRYTVAYPYPNRSIYTVTVKEASPVWTQKQVSLEESMLSTNAPSNHGDELRNMLDGNVETIFHTTWGTGTYTKLYWYDGCYYGDGVSEWPYLQIELPEPLYNLQFSYTTRANNDYAPLGLILQGSTDGSTWDDIRTFTSSDEEDPLPTTRAAEYLSPIVSITKTYNHLRLQLTSAQNKNYLVFAEFALYENIATYPNLTPIPIDLSAGIKGKNARSQPYLQIQRPEGIEKMKFRYTTRYIGDVDKDGIVSSTDVQEMADLLLDKRGGRDMPVVDVDRDGNLTLADLTALTNRIKDNTQTVCAPSRIRVDASKDGESWSIIQTITSGLPTTANQTYTSEEFELDDGYKYIRLVQPYLQDYDYFKLCDLKIYQMAAYKTNYLPYGKDYDVEVDFLTDHPTSEYNVPRIDITFGDGVTWGWNQYISSKETYVDATIQIDGAGVFPDMEETAVQIRGRGNTSWGYGPNEKNPYRLKFAAKQKPFGLTKGKSWVLLANKQTGSMTSNALAMKIADMVESQGCNHIIPCELYINGQYRGSYNFTEKVGFSNNSIDLPDETNATLLTLDSYSHLKEDYYFFDAQYNMEVALKEPDLTDDIEDGLLTEEEAEAKFEAIESAFNAFTLYTKNGDISRLDVDAFVRAMPVNALVRNEECKHPKSWFLYNTDYTSPDSLWTFGPVWDFDWAYGYDRNYDYFIYNAEDDLFANMTSSNVGYPFFRDLLRKSDTVKRAYYLLWKDFMESGKLDELIEYCDDYFEYVKPSFQHNYTKWSDGSQYSTTTANAKTWLRKRANYIYNNLQKYDE